jgi:hypothetical protein
MLIVVSTVEADELGALPFVNVAGELPFRTAPSAPLPIDDAELEDVSGVDGETWREAWISAFVAEAEPPALGE